MFAVAASSISYDIGRLSWGCGTLEFANVGNSLLRSEPSISSTSILVLDDFSDWFLRDSSVIIESYEGSNLSLDFVAFAA